MRLTISSDPATAVNVNEERVPGGIGRLVPAKRDRSVRGLSVAVPGAKDGFTGTDKNFAQSLGRVADPIEGRNATGRIRAKDTGQQIGDLRVGGLSL
jgi:hypothetical protein